MFLHVEKASYIDEYKISIEFNNGKERVVDLMNELSGEVFEPLKRLDFFKNFFISHNTIEWQNGADFAPEFLYEIGIDKKTVK